mmetsp:Transcript_2444/g.5809  ORF Transcript_2444/g.5809 Transcript_2444/m.5809 type:complete len:82 (+) Transcript_2444:444-689(+)
MHKRKMLATRTIQQQTTPSLLQTRLDLLMPAISLPMQDAYASCLVGLEQERSKNRAQESSHDCWPPTLGDALVSLRSMDSR